MNDISMMTTNEANTEETARKDRIKAYQNILNYYRARSLSLEVVLASNQLDLSIPPHMITAEELEKNTQGLLENISLVLTLKECVKLISNTITYLQIMKSGDSRVLGRVMHKIEGVVSFSKSLMKLYNELYSETDLFEKRKSHRFAMFAYEQHLEYLQKNQKEINSETKELMEKAELQIYKINLIRSIKGILISFITVNFPDLLPQVQQFATPDRRNLTLEDFYE